MDQSKNMETQNIHQYVTKKLNLGFKVKVGLAIVASSLLILFYIIGPSAVLTIPPFIFIIGFYFSYLYLGEYRKARTGFLNIMATSLELSFQEDNTNELVKPGGTFWHVPEGWSIKITNILYGKRNNLDLKIFDILTNSQNKKNPRLLMVFEIEYKTDMPHICITSRELLSGDWKKANFPPSFKLTGTHLTFSGGFSKYFDVEVEKEFEQEAYQILTPDIMEFLIDNARYTSFEFLDDKMYMFPGRPVDSMDQFKKMFSIFDFLKDKLHVNRSVYAIKKHL